MTSFFIDPARLSTPANHPPAARCSPWRVAGPAVACLFGIWWTALGLHALGVPQHAALLLGAFAAAGLIGGLVHAARRHVFRALRPAAKGWLATAILGEAILIPVAVILLAAWGRPQWSPAVIGLIVGLHFLPMARALHDDFLVVHAVAISLVAALSLLLPEPARSALLGCGVAAILFGTIGCRVALGLARAPRVPPA